MSLKKQAASGMIWTFSQQFGNQLINFVVSIFLARLLLPEEFGLIGMISVFVGVGNALLNAGLTNSLIRSKDLDERDYSTVFFFNLVASILIYIVIYFVAPLIAKFYDQPILIGIIRLYCISFIIAALMAVQQARMTKNMDFKTQTIISIPSLVIGGGVGISMAYLGYGVWSLVWNQLVTQSVKSVQFWIYSGWQPSRVFDRDKFKEHFNFGYKITLSNLIAKIFDNSYIIIIGRFFAASQVGFYTRAETMKDLPVKNISLALNRVTYPLFSTIQDDNERLKSVYKRLMKMVVFVVAPVMVFSAILAEPVFRFLLTEKWLPAVPYFQILCGAGILYPVHMYNLNVLIVKGRSDILLKLTIVKNVLLTIAIIIGVQFGIFGLLYAQVLLSLVSFFINAFYTDKFLDYSALEQIRDLIPIVALSLIAGAGIFFVDIGLSYSLDIVRITTGTLTGLVIYLLLSYMFNFSSLFELKKLILKK